MDVDGIGRIEPLKDKVTAETDVDVIARNKAKTNQAGGSSIENRPEDQKRKYLQKEVSESSTEK